MLHFHLDSVIGHVRIVYRQLMLAYPMNLQLQLHSRGTAVACLKLPRAVYSHFGVTLFTSMEEVRRGRSLI